VRVNSSKAFFSAGMEASPLHPFLFRRENERRYLMRTPQGAAFFFCRFWRRALSVRVGALRR